MQYIKTICLYILSSNAMDQISSKYDLELIFTQFKRMYFMSYHFIFMFLATFTEKYLFLKLMYREIKQKEFKHKLLRFPLQCHLEKELKSIRYDTHQRNTELEVTDHKLT